jgi:hypothetical protein
MINNKNLIIGGIGNFFLIDIEKHELIKIFENNENYYSIHSINDNLFICGCYNGSESIIYIKFLLNNELNNVCENKRNHKFNITSILQSNKWNLYNTYDKVNTKYEELVKKNDKLRYEISNLKNHINHIIKQGNLIKEKNNKMKIDKNYETVSQNLIKYDNI